MSKNCKPKSLPIACLPQGMKVDGWKGKYFSRFSVPKAQGFLQFNSNIIKCLLYARHYAKYFSGGCRVKLNCKRHYKRWFSTLRGK